MRLLASGARSTEGYVYFADVGQIDLDQMRDAIFHVDVSAATTGVTGDTLKLFFQSAMVGTTDYQDFLCVEVGSSQATAHKHGFWQRDGAVGSTDAVEEHQDGAIAANTAHMGPVGGIWRMYWVVSATSSIFTFSVDFDGTRFRA